MRFWRCHDYPCDRSKRQSRTLNLETELVGLGEIFRPLDRALLVDARSGDHALKLRPIVAIEETIEGLDRPGERVLVLVALGEKIVILLVGKVRIDRNRAVEENLELPRTGIEVRRGSEHDHVRRLHLLEDRRRVVLDDALVRLLTGVATRAIADLLVGDADLRDLVTRTTLAAAVAVGYAQSIFFRALRELVAEEIGVAALARRG